MYLLCRISGMGYIYLLSLQKEYKVNPLAMIMRTYYPKFGGFILTMMRLESVPFIDPIYFTSVFDAASGEEEEEEECKRETLEIGRPNPICTGRIYARRKASMKE